MKDSLYKSMFCARLGSQAAEFCLGPTGVSEHNSLYNGMHEATWATTLEFFCVQPLLFPRSALK
jgi:hypothetical protein